MFSSKNDLDQQLSIVEKMHKSGSITKDEYHKTLINLAHKYATTGQIEDVRVLVGKLDDAYLRNTLPEQMISDVQFCETAHFVATKLAEAGIALVSDEDVFLSMAKIGKA